MVRTRLIFHGNYLCSIAFSLLSLSVVIFSFTEIQTFDRFIIDLLVSLSFRFRLFRRPSHSTRQMIYFLLVIIFSPLDFARSFDDSLAFSFPSVRRWPSTHIMDTFLFWILIEFVITLSIISYTSVIIISSRSTETNNWFTNTTVRY